ncbi:LamG domain-containing protein [Kribbella sp. CA-253562]|uniref:LamG domain-containing protein n=1 Tax=Kribbella sp. CA-253562 TaxID=3239942 RepID=UPI003D9311EB
MGTTKKGRAMAGAATLALLLTAACGSAAGDVGADQGGATDPPPQPQLLLTFDDQRPGPAAGREIRGDGAAVATIDLLSVNKPTTAYEAGRDGGVALRLPAYAGTEKGSFAALRVEPEEWLSPGSSEFTFGADVRLDGNSSGSPVDNGDNVLQRGLFADSAQFKIQVDRARPSCVVRGTDGSVVVKSKPALNPARWYRLSCHRLDNTVTLTVTDLTTGSAPATVSKTGAIGSLDLIGSEPLAIGAKIGEDGEIVRSSTDQFNGRIDNVSYLRS